MKKILVLVMIMALAAGVLAGCGGPSSSSAFDKEKEISVISREPGSGTRGAFIELFGVEVKEADGNKKDMTTVEAQVKNNTGVMMSSVEGDAYSIGYISLGSLNETVKAVKIDGIDATNDNVKNGSYTVSRPFNIATKGAVTGLAKDFIDFILSSDGQAVIAKSYIAIKDDAQAFAGEKPSGRIVVGGSSSVTPIMEKLKEAYLEINPNAQIEIQESDSSTGIKDATSGVCDIGMSSRDLKAEELQALTSTQIAIDGIAVIVNNNNTVSELSKDQVRQIFTGEVTKWSDIIK